MTFFGPIQHLFEQAPIFVLVLFRLGGLMIIAPVLGSATIPAKIKILLALVMAAAVFPLVPKVAYVPNSLAHLALGVGGEIIIGITMGFALYLMFIGMQVGAEMISQQMGLGLARLVDPNSQASTTVISQFFLLLATLIYILMGGHLILIRALVGTFQTVPLMGNSLANSPIQLLTSIITGAFMLGIRVAGPALVAIYLATLSLGFISRTMPQLNILAAGFPIRILLGLVLIMGSLGAILLLFQETISAVLRQMGSVFI